MRGMTWVGVFFGLATGAALIYAAHKFSAFMDPIVAEQSPEIRL